ncbi:MAG: mannose-1-phosphate guanylyltransferase [Bacteroidia bacterium]|nr:mannose-1-phosphate guanylyltransferase [Bacteroidia bacterium]
MSNIYCVIMAGGIGSRFWPMSRNAKPKQFLDILGNGKTLIQQTFDRLTLLCPPENILVVTNEDYAQLVAEQLPAILPQHILSEPARKNTAPCIAYAAYKIAAINPEALMVVAPSDHIITNTANFITAAQKGIDFASKHNCLLTLGIQPSRPDTGYGYIQVIDDKHDEANKISKVKTFTEKPNLEMAKFFLLSGEFLWNTGITISSVQATMEAIKFHLPELSVLFEEGIGLYNTTNETEFIKRIYPVCTNISIDFGVMEKAKNVYVLSTEFGWSDLGTYGSLYEHIKHDNNGNAVVGKNVMLYDSKNCIVNVPKNKLVVIQGLEDYIVVERDDVLLICKKDDEQNIRQYVNDVKINKGDKYV